MILLSLKIFRRKTRGAAVKALILTPTRELAQQVYDNLESYNQGLKIVVVYGGTSMSVQTKNLNAGADIVVATLPFT